MVILCLKMTLLKTVLQGTLAVLALNLLVMNNEFVSLMEIGRGQFQHAYVSVYIYIYIYMYVCMYVH